MSRLEAGLTSLRQTLLALGVLYMTSAHSVHITGARIPLTRFV
jgi:hypothetical protein